VDVDTAAMAEASAYLQRQARIKRLPAGVPAEYDEDYYRHNIPTASCRRWPASSASFAGRSCCRR
jgi:hypothetical protein